MRLKSIKLAGFKSFVDPTVIPLRGNRTAIVGPNGCGKSNVIDAVRWVIGESSAKQLRAENMAEVIFNGCQTRKPVGQASIELVFDNSDGRIAGEYANYNEISIKRLVTRDGQSAYYLNNTRCRRKDVVDLFLGTGLGPRSYAIIEQGMISQLIESKPEELRMHLEEVAGISKYKERRRETENRIRHTRENLERLNDLQQELDKQLQHLKRQSQAAQRYQELKAEERKLKAELHALHWRQLAANSEAMHSKTRILEVELEAKHAEQTEITVQIEKQREERSRLNDAMDEVQDRYYHLGQQVATLEQQIQHARKEQTRMQAELERIVESQQRLSDDIELEQAQLNEHEQEIRGLDEEHRQARVQADGSLQNRQQAEIAVQTWQAAWDEFNSHYHELSRKLDVGKTRAVHLEQRIGTLQADIHKREQELLRIDLNVLEIEVSELAEQLEQSHGEQTQAQLHLKELQETILRERQGIDELNKSLSHARGELQQAKAEHGSMVLLQQAALGSNDQAKKQWVVAQGLENAKHLAEQIEVDAGWEQAVETVLGEHLEAVCVTDWDKTLHQLKEIGQGHIELWHVEKTGAASAVSGNKLLNKVKAPWSLAPVLGSIYAVGSLAEALALVGGLAAHESVVTREGIWLGPCWARFLKPQGEKSGILQREQAIKQRAAQIAELTERVERLETEFKVARERLMQLEQERDERRAEEREKSGIHHQLQAKLNSQKMILNQQCERQDELSVAIAQAKEEVDRLKPELSQTHEQCNDWTAELEMQQQKRETLLAERSTHEQNLVTARERAEQDKSVVDRISIQIQNLRTRIEFLQRSLSRSQEQRTVLAQQQAQHESALASLKDPAEALQPALDGLLEQRFAVEQELTTLRQQTQHIDHELKLLEQRHGAIQHAVDEKRSELESIRLETRAIEVRQMNHEESVKAEAFDLQTLLAELTANAAIPVWEENIASVEKRIQRLGAINLAAIEEYQTVSERKTYLDAQVADLNQALATLEEAMQKIDKETRAKFKETYEAVNSGFQELFPKIFGGGEAALELTENDWLNTGVTVRAQPPGKRNSSVHMLSGGEKALTAVALVFSLFKLNPAPFCILDEVDAPLDDINVHRFSRLVEEMSKEVQFVYISHNKVSIECAEQLTGVTMHEPGVSRIVAVDVAEALAMAE